MTCEASVPRPRREELHGQSRLRRYTTRPSCPLPRFDFGSPNSPLGSRLTNIAAAAATTTTTAASRVDSHPLSLVDQTHRRRNGANRCWSEERRRIKTRTSGSRCACVACFQLAGAEARATIDASSIIISDHSCRFRCASSTAAAQVPLTSTFPLRPVCVSLSPPPFSVSLGFLFLLPYATPRRGRSVYFGQRR